MAATAQPKYFDLGQRIRRARKRAGISQERLAGLVGITRRHLIRIENGEHLPSRELRNRLAESTASPRDELAVDEDDEEADPVANEMSRALMSALRIALRELEKERVA